MGIQIIPERRKPSMAEKFSNAVRAGLEIGKPIFKEYQQQQKKAEQFNQENEYLNQLIGRDVSGITDPKMRQDLLNYALQEQNKASEFGRQADLEREKFEMNQQLKSQELQGKQREKIAPFESGLNVLERMRQIRKRGRLGIGSSYSPFSSTQKDASEYEQLGKSLISLASNIPIRNQQEFQTLAERLYDPTITDASAEGILNAMERIINNSLEGVEESEFEAPQRSKERPSLKSFLR